MSHRYRFGSFELDAAERRLISHGQPVALTGRAFDTLLYLVRHPGRLVTREALLDAVWGETIVEEGNLHWTISVVRRALAQVSDEIWIETVRGLGYRFLVPVEIVDDAAPVAVAATSGPEAPSEVASETETPETKAPPSSERPRGISRSWLAAAGAAVLLTILAWTVAGRRGNAVAPETPGVAVAGFRDLSPRGADRWVGTALTEMLAADLARGGWLRLVPSDDVASMWRDLGLRPDSPMGRAELAQVRRHLGSEWVIVGSYLRLDGQDPPLRVDALLRHAGTGETRAVVSRRGRETELFALADSLAGDLRRALGTSGRGEPGDDAARGAMPATARAQRLYAEGLERLQRRDALAAAERLRAATDAEPEFPGAWLALARAYELLGFERQAEDVALKALQRSHALPERQWLAAEATYLRIAKRMPEAIERLRRLYELSSHAFDDGLVLADAYLRAGQVQEALACVDDLRREHPAAQDDARLAMVETEAFAILSDESKRRTAAERTITAARRQGMVQVEIRALQHRALGRIRSGAASECEGAFEDLALARRKAEATGDRLLLAGVLQYLGVALSDCRPTAIAEQDQVERAALELYREIGALGKMPPLLYNLGSNRREEGDLLGADRLMHEAFETCEAHASRCRERFLHPLGVNRLHRGELAEARRMFEEAVRANRLLGNRRRAAEAQGHLPDVAGWGGDLARAVELQRQVLVLRQEIGLAQGIAWAHGDLAAWLAEAGRGPEALEHARQAVHLAAGQGNESLDAYSRASLASAHLASGNLDEADRESAAAIARLPPPHTPFASFFIWSVRARVLLARGQLDAAEALIDEGLRLARGNGFVTHELQGRLFRARLALARGRTAEARQLASDLAAEAQAKGFGLIAQRSRDLLAAPL